MGHVDERISTGIPAFHEHAQRCDGALGKWPGSATRNKIAAPASGRSGPDELYRPIADPKPVQKRLRGFLQRF